MPAVHGSDDDFLYQLQAPTEPSSSDSANVFLNRTITRIRNGQIAIEQVPSRVIDGSFWTEILRHLKHFWRR
jgi:hypothetical protein